MNLIECPKFEHQIKPLIFYSIFAIYVKF